PMNGDAAEALAVAKSRAAAAPAPAPSQPPPPPAPSPPPQSPIEEPALATLVMEPPAPAPPPAPPPAAEPSPLAGGLETFDGRLNFKPEANSAGPAEGLELQEEVELKPAPLTIDGLAR